MTNLLAILCVREKHISNLPPKVPGDRGIMFKNYLKIGFRSLIRNKGYSFINIFGLALGVTLFMLIFLFIQDELSFDRYHTKANRIYRIVEDLDPAEHSSSQPFSVGPTLLNDYPDLIEHSVRFFNFQSPALTLEYTPDKRFNEKRLFFADSTVFDIFDFGFMGGNPRALDAPNQIILTESMARKYFGDKDPIGKVLRYEGQLDLTVAAILEDVPSNSHFEFDFLVSFATLRQFYEGEPRGWYWNPCWTYLLLRKDASPGMLEAQLPVFVEKYFPDIIKDRVKLELQPLTDIHLRSHLDFEIRPNSDISYVYIFSVIAAFVLLIACINFMNLATARSARRAREVGMRKVMGAGRGQLIKQFLGESMLVSSLSVLLSIPLTLLALPYLNSFLQKQIQFDIASNHVLPATLFAVAIGVGLVAGIYPAFFLSGFQPVQVLKGKLKLGKVNFSDILRKSLVVAQFAISVVLIIGTTIAYQQLRYFQNANIGFNKEHVLMVPIQGTRIPARFKEIKQQLLQNPDIRSVSASELVLGTSYQTHSYTPQGFTESQQFQRLTVRRDFVRTMGLELLAGRDFSDTFVTDDSTALIINETMVRHLGWGSPEEAIGRAFRVGDDTRVHNVVGVLKDFNYASLHNAIAPFILDMPDTQDQNDFFNRYLAMRIASTDISETIDFVRQKWAAFLPDKPFEFFFMDENIDELYRAEERLGQVAGIFASFAIFVACLGLFGLASFTTEQRTKEIGVRKVLGASLTSIFLNLSQDFLGLVTLAVLLACPIAYLVAQSWLQTFAYRTTIGFMPFLAAGATACLVAWLTVGFQAFKAALANPVKSLKYE